MQQMSLGLTSSRNGARYAAERMGMQRGSIAWHERGIYNLGTRRRDGMPGILTICDSPFGNGVSHR